MASEKITKFIEDIKTLSVMELAELVSAIEEEFGVSAAPVAVAGAAVAADAGEAAGSAQTEFDVILKSAGEAKMNVIKVVKEITGAALMDAKKMVDGAPATIKEKVSQDEANSIKEKLVAAGADVEIK